MKVLDNSTNYITEISYEYFDGTKETFNVDDIKKYGQIKLLDKIDCGMVMFDLKFCSVSAKSDKMDITIYASVYGCNERNDGVLSIVDKMNNKVYYSDNGSDEKNTFELNGKVYPKWRYDKSSVYYSLAEADLVMLGKITTDVAWRVYDLQNGEFLYKLEAQDEAAKRMPAKINKDSNKRIKSFTIVTTNDKVIEFDENKIEKNSARKLINVIIKTFKLKELHTLDIISSDESSVLSVRSENGQFSLGIINEASGDIYYYYNNVGSETDFVELNGESYPSFMISNDDDVFKTAVTDFVLTGTYSKRISWRVENL